MIKACEAGVISEDNTRRLAELSNLILQHISSELKPDLRERILGLMSGHVIELQEDKWLRQGRILTFCELALDGSMSIADAAKRAGLSEDDFTKELEEYKNAQNTPIRINS